MKRPAKQVRGWRAALLAVVLLTSYFSLHAATLNVTNFGAWGDASNLWFTVTSNSATVVKTNGWGAGDVGKILSLTNAGPWGSNATIHQDFVAQITSINNTTNAVVNRTAGNSGTWYGIYGTCSSTGLQACINAAATGDTISIPVGRYLIIPPVWDTTWMGNYRQNESAVTISKGGIRLLGDSRTGTVLIGNGMWQNTVSQGGYVYRGFLFRLESPFTNGVSAPLAFENMTWDGGIYTGWSGDQGFPGNNNTGDGWDWTHGALFLVGSGSTFASANRFVNLNVAHWRGEMLKTGIDFYSSDFYGMTNCLFYDGNGSANNIEYGKVISGCTFSNLNLVSEEKLSDTSIPILWEFNYITNCRLGIVIQGADTNLPLTTYTIRSNLFNTSADSIDVGHAQNITVQGNVFLDSNVALFLGSVGAQRYGVRTKEGNAVIQNVVFNDNLLTNTTPLTFYEGLRVYATNNVYDVKAHGGVHSFADGSGGAPYGNVYLVSNRVVNSVADGAFNAMLFSGSTSRVPFDDPSNIFPPTYSVYSSQFYYYLGRFQSISDNTYGTNKLAGDDNESQVPEGATMLVTNQSGAAVHIYTTTTFPSGYVEFNLPANGSVVLYRNTIGVEPLWLTNAPTLTLPWSGYVSQGGTPDGVTNSLAWFNSGTNAMTNVVFTGLFTNLITINQDGTGNDPLHLTFDTQPSFSWPTVAEGGKIIGGTGTRNIIIDGAWLQVTSNRVDAVYAAPYFTNTFDGVSLTVESNVTVRNCTFVDFCPRASNRWNLTTAPTAIRLLGAMKNVLVHNNNITNTGNGIVFGPQVGVNTNIQAYSNTVWMCSWGISCETASGGAFVYDTQIWANRINNGIGWDSGSPSPFHQDGIILGAPNTSSNINPRIYRNWIGPLCGYESTTAAIYYETTQDQKYNIDGEILNNVIAMTPGQWWNTGAIAWNATNTLVANNTIDYSGTALHADGRNARVYNNLILNADTRYFIDGAFATNCAFLTGEAMALDYTVVMSGHYWFNPGSYTYNDYRDCGGTPGACCFSAYDVHSFNRAAFALNADYSPVTGDTNITGLGTNLAARFNTDFYDNPRPSGAWTVGAIEAPFTVPPASTNLSRISILNVRSLHIGP